MDDIDEDPPQTNSLLNTNQESSIEITTQPPSTTARKLIEEL
jgi:hypothetical protein